MEDNAIPVINGARVGTPASDDLAVQAGHQSEMDEARKDSTMIDLLRQEIDGLRSERSELQEKLVTALAKAGQSEAATKAIAAKTFELEGDLMHTQQDLTAASSVAEDVQAEAQGLRLTVHGLEADKASLAVSKAALESQIKDLEERMGAYTSLDADLTAEREKVAAMESKGEEEISALALTEKNLLMQLRVLREEKEMVVEEAKRRTSLEEELEKAIIELAERNSHLEAKIYGFTSTIGRDLAVDQKKQQAEVILTEGLTVSWPVAAAAAASTATVAAIITAFCLQARQR